MKRRSGPTLYSRFAWTVLALNIVVIVWGGFVRASGSGAGCGAHWPLCNGVVVPQNPKIETLIELGHRLTSGLALVAVLVLGIATLRRNPRAQPQLPENRERRRLAGLAMLFIAGEAAIGAGIVLLKYVGANSSAARAAWMAGHLVNTFLLLAVLALLAERASSDANGAPSRNPRRSVDLWALVALLLTAITGSIAALGDTLFPASSLGAGMLQDLSPSAHFLIQLRGLHPVVAILAGLLWFALAQKLGSSATGAADPPANPGASRTALWARRLKTLVVFQFAVGVTNLALLAPVPLQLVHLFLADLVWIAAVLMLDNARRLPSAALPP
ncbi:MAG: COX15/CtaA family protein [Thermoanaerobaculia bacterium]